MARTDRLVNARTRHLIALVKDGATLRDAADAYGISAERVRQILKEEGLSAQELPGRGDRVLRRQLFLHGGLAPAIEAMWRAGIGCDEIAKAFALPSQAVEEAIRARVPPGERSRLTERRLDDRRSRDERFGEALREAADILGRVPGISEDDRLRAQALLDGWRAARGPAELPRADATPSHARRLDVGELARELDRFKGALRAAGLRESTINAYLLGATLFVRWLAGDYAPGPRRVATRSAP